MRLRSLRCSTLRLLHFPRWLHALLLFPFVYWFCWLVCYVDCRYVCVWFVDSLIVITVGLLYGLVDYVYIYRYAFVTFVYIYTPFTRLRLLFTFTFVPARLRVCYVVSLWLRCVTFVVAFGCVTCVGYFVCVLRVSFSGYADAFQLFVTVLRYWFCVYRFAFVTDWLFVVGAFWLFVALRYWLHVLPVCTDPFTAALQLRAAFCVPARSVGRSTRFVYPFVRVAFLCWFCVYSWCAFRFYHPAHVSRLIFTGYCARCVLITLRGFCTLRLRCPRNVYALDWFYVCVTFAILRCVYHSLVNVQFTTDSVGYYVGWFRSARRTFDFTFPCQLLVACRTAVLLDYDCWLLLDARTRTAVTTLRCTRSVLRFWFVCTLVTPHFALVDSLHVGVTHVYVFPLRLLHTFTRGYLFWFFYSPGYVAVDSRYRSFSFTHVYVARILRLPFYVLRVVTGCWLLLLRCCTVVTTWIRCCCDFTLLNVYPVTHIALLRCLPVLRCRLRFDFHALFDSLPLHPLRLRLHIYVLPFSLRCGCCVCVTRFVGWVYAFYACLVTHLMRWFTVDFYVTHYVWCSRCYWTVTFTVVYAVPVVRYHIRLVTTRCCSGLRYPFYRYVTISVTRCCLRWLRFPAPFVVCLLRLRFVGFRFTTRLRSVLLLLHVCYWFTRWLRWLFAALRYSCCGGCWILRLRLFDSLWFGLRCVYHSWLPVVPVTRILHFVDSRCSVLIRFFVTLPFVYVYAFCVYAFYVYTPAFTLRVSRLLHPFTGWLITTLFTRLRYLLRSFALFTHTLHVALVVNILRTFITLRFAGYILIFVAHAFAFRSRCFTFGFTTGYVHLRWLRLFVPFDFTVTFWLILITRLPVYSVGCYVLHLRLLLIFVGYYTPTNVFARFVVDFRFLLLLLFTTRCSFAFVLLRLLLRYYHARWLLRCVCSLDYVLILHVCISVVYVPVCVYVDYCPRSYLAFTLCRFVCVCTDCVLFFWFVLPLICVCARYLRYVLRLFVVTFVASYYVCGYGRCVCVTRLHVDYPRWLYARLRYFAFCVAILVGRLHRFTPHVVAFAAFTVDLPATRFTFDSVTFVVYVCYVDALPDYARYSTVVYAHHPHAIAVDFAHYYRLVVRLPLPLVCWLRFRTPAFVLHVLRTVTLLLVRTVGYTLLPTLLPHVPHVYAVDCSVLFTGCWFWMRLRGVVDYGCVGYHVTDSLIAFAIPFTLLPFVLTDARTFTVEFPFSVCWFCTRLTFCCIVTLRFVTLFVTLLLFSYITTRCTFVR